jgi:hypothetical protein
MPAGPAFAVDDVQPVLHLLGGILLVLQLVLVEVDCDIVMQVVVGFA